MSSAFGLRLEWSYAYRGHQCRNNLFYTGDGQIVYFCAGVAVVYDVKSAKQQFFLGHSDDLMCMAPHPGGKLFATGQLGNEPYICVWDSSSLQTISIVKELKHPAGVAIVAFSGDGQRLLSVGMDDLNSLNIWDWKKAKKLCKAAESQEKVLDAQFHPQQNDLVVTCGLKHIRFWTLKGNILSCISGDFGSQSNPQTFPSFTFGFDGGTVLTGSISGSIVLWKDHKLAGNIDSAHVGGVFSILKSNDGYITGGKDGQIRFWDQSFKPLSAVNLTICKSGYADLWIRSLCLQGDKLLVGTQFCEIFEVSLRDRDNPKCLLNGHSEGELWALATHPKKPLFATGGDDQTLRIWNSAEHKLLEIFPTQDWVRSCAFSQPDGSLLSVGLSNGSVLVLKSKDLCEVSKWQDHKRPIHEMKFSPNGEFLATGCNDSAVDVYQVSQRFKRIASALAGNSHVTHMDWSKDNKFIQVNNGHAERIVLKLPEEIKAISWDSWTCTIGAEVVGIWPKYAKTEDINAVDSNVDKNVLATGDDFGSVKLFPYPTLQKGAKFSKYIGHSAHVTNVRWSHDRESLISIGGADHAILQWRLVAKTAETPGESTVREKDLEEDVEDTTAVDEDSDVERAKGDANYTRVVSKEKLSSLMKKLVRTELKVENRKRLQAPQASLQLAHTFGYRGYDCHNNIFFTLSGELVYHTAALGVVLSSSNQQRFYVGHTDDILCATIHPTKDLVATGQVGKHPSVHVWDATTMTSVSILKDQHDCGICAVDFSGDGKRLLSVGLDENHMIVMWDWKKGEKLASARGHKDKIFGIKFYPKNEEKFVTIGVKHIKFWTHAGGGFTSTRGIFGTKGKIGTILTVCFSLETDLCYTGTASGMVYIWSKDNQLVKTAKVVGANDKDASAGGPCFAITSLEKGFVTGGKDGCVSLWDDQFERCLKAYPITSASVAKDSAPITQERPVIRSVILGHGKIVAGTKNGEIIAIDQAGVVSCLVQGHKEGEVWGLSCHPIDLQCATVSDDGYLRLWTLSEPRKLYKFKELKKPARSVDYSPDGKLIAVGFKDGSFTVFKVAGFNEIFTCNHRKEEISDVKFSPSPGTYLAVGSHDNFVDIYEVSSGKRVGICKGSSSYITHVDWDSSGTLLLTNSGAKEELFFEAPGGNRTPMDPKVAPTIDWSLRTCILGAELEGIWPPTSDVTDINAACLNKKSQLVVSGDDFGFVKLFDYPVTGKFAKFKQYLGHSAHVTNVRWTADSSWLVTVGGSDATLILWKLSVGQPSGSSDQSDTDSEEEGGFDSDVDSDKKTDFTAKMYKKPLRDRLEADVKGANLQHYEATVKPLVSREAKTPIPVIRTDPNSLPAKKKKRIVNVQRLQLEHIFGYRGFDCNCNVHYINNGADVVLHAAAAVIVMNLASGQQKFYLEHTDDILALTVNLNPKFPNIVASGQLDAFKPTIHLWDGKTLKNICILQANHDKGVICLNFSASGKYVLSVGIDDSHTLTVWKWQDGSVVATGPGHIRRIFDAQFRPDSDGEFVSVGIKHVKFWKICGSQIIGKRGTTGSLQDATTSQHKMFTMLSIAFAPEKVTYTGCVTGDIWVWKDVQLERIVKSAHNGPVFSLYTSLSDGLIVSGSKEKRSSGGNCVKLWDQKLSRSKPYTLQSVTSAQVDIVKAVCRTNQKILVGLASGEVIEVTENTGVAHVLMHSHSAGEIWGLSTHPSRDIFATASCDKTLCIWDVEKKVLLLKKPLEQQATCVAFGPDGGLVAVGTKPGDILLFHSADLTSWDQKRDRNCIISEIRFSPNGLYLAVGCDDCAVDIYDVSKEQKLTRTAYCKALPHPVRHMDFSADSKYLKASTSHFETRIFSVPDGKEIDKSDTKKIIWASWTDTVGPEVAGIWPEHWERGEVNTVDLSHMGHTIAVGDDGGVVKILDFPCEQKNARDLKYTGHSANVTNVRFTYDDSYLISVGGEDSCIFVWRCGGE